MTLLRKRLLWIEPTRVAAELARHQSEEGLIWLDGDGGALGQHITLAVDPVEQHCCRGLPGETGARNPFNTLRELTPGHWTGWLSFDAAAWTEPGNPWRRDPMASLWIARHDPVLRFELGTQVLYLEGVDRDRFLRMETFLGSLGESPVPEEPQNPLPLGCSWKHQSDREDFMAGVSRIRELIASGDLFQANLTSCASAELRAPISNLDLYGRLRRRCPAPFSGVLIGGGAAAGEAVLSTSPERFLQVDPKGAVQTRPIKGTRPRHTDPLIDDALAAELVCSAKDRAENVMIVDLLRNDLGRVCEPGSVQVPELVKLESYARVHHLTSVVTGQLRVGTTWVDLLEASWPGGSITGAPKLRACQRLQELEPLGRGPYCGSILHIDWDGGFDSNILIRSLLRKDNQLRVHAGCGIVADSDPAEEADELNWKLLPLLEALA